MNKQNIIIFLLIVIAVFTGIAALDSIPDNTEISREAFKEHYRVHQPPMPDSIFFAGEKVPLDIYHVKERLDRELLVNTYWQSNQLLYLKRANRWFPVIEPILKEQGVPDDFKYLALVESGLINANSPAGAKGFWQFIKETAQRFGLEVNAEVDVRLNIKKSTVAACRYLKEMYALYGSWTLAAAGYNTGQKNIDMHSTNQGINDYYFMHLHPETMRYVFRILAEKIIFENPSAYGFYLSENDLYMPLPTHEITVDTTITDLFEFARKTGISYQILKMYNPWLTDYRVLPNKSRKKYQISLPE
ncbi:MAG: lytic transglycosylase domain-containing protein [Bacteroidales bacterium]|jgi:hypothetical protein|nr:lytic transglycosylase domain-containing protein [Bacteroidales bacterium]